MGSLGECSIITKILMRGQQSPGPRGGPGKQSSGLGKWMSSMSLGRRAASEAGKGKETDRPRGPWKE